MSGSKKCPIPVILLKMMNWNLLGDDVEAFSGSQADTPCPHPYVLSLCL